MLKKRKKRKDPIHLLMVVCTELVVILGMLIICTYVFPDNPVTKALVSFVATPPDVILDPGHGGYDAGSGDKGINEKDITLQITKKVGLCLEQKGMKVTYTRESDEVPWPADEQQDLTERVAISNKSKAKAFISIHTNASDAKEGFGFEIWSAFHDEKACSLANHIVDSLDALAYTENRGIKDQDTSPLQVLQQNTLPAVLVEVGFLENDSDFAWLTQDEKQQKIAEKIADGIYQYIEEQKGRK